MIPPLATFYDVQAFGAVGDGLGLDSPAIQAAIDACAKNGGGTVWVPAGNYIIGPLFLKSNLTLYLDAGATLLGSEELADYPVIEGRWEGAQQLAYAPLITGQNLENIALTGRGRVDGRGAHWWKAFKAGRLAHPRPRLISFADCKNVLIDGITAANSPAWTIHPVRCENVNIRGVTVINPPDSPNTDGINPDSCRLVRISDCYVSVGDDCITIKAGTQLEPSHLRAACRDIAITNCTLERGHGGVVIGSEMSGDVRNVVISNCIFIGTDRGIRLKSRRGRGGTVEDVHVTNLIMDGVLCPFTMNLYYHAGARGDEYVSDKSAQPLGDGTPAFRRIHISHVTARDVKIAAGFLYGLAEMPLEDITFSDVSISLSPGAEPDYPEMADGIPSMAQAGFFVRNARAVRFDNVLVTGQIGPAFDIDASVEADIRP